MFPPASGGERAISGQGRAAQGPPRSPTQTRISPEPAGLSPPHTQAHGSVDALPALGPTHGAPPPAQGGNFLLSPQPGPDCRGQWVMILSTFSSPGHPDRRPDSSSCDFSGCSFTRKRFIFYAEGLGYQARKAGVVALAAPPWVYAFPADLFICCTCLLVLFFVHL